VNTAQYAPAPQITVLDTGGQYCHLIARKVRDLGVYTEVRSSDTPAAELRARRGIIISGGPSSVYEEGSPTVDAAIFSAGPAVLGICYGQQLMARLLGGTVRGGEKGEFGLASLDLVAEADPLLEGLADHQQIWMSHRDTVEALPAGFRVLGRTDTCRFAAMGRQDARLYGVQFHPEVVHTHQGNQLLANFLFRVCGCRKDWSPKHQAPALEQKIREVVGARKVFFFVSGGVDSTVAFTLCLRALGKERVRGIYVDTGLMREGETEFVRGIFREQGDSFRVVDARERFLGALAGVRDPERKRGIIGEEFVRVQEEALESHHVLDESWILGQGTIYPDTIESGGTAKAAVIKTHHNRVAGIQRLMETNRIVEPLTSFYKDEVRAVGRELGLPEELLERHPFPGPGLAVRCLCASGDEPVRRTADGWLLPVRSVGVQGDSRSYAHVLCLDRFPSPEAGLQQTATELVNTIPGVNRIVAMAGSQAPLATLRVHGDSLTEQRLARLRRADAIVRRLSHASGFDRQVWQFPVILIPLGRPECPDSVVLRPVDSVDGMTAQSVAMPEALLREICARLLEVEGLSSVLYDLTHKPPGTIEWE
jgi:GMP synthase (glutamine-hydrolysing)